MNVTVEVVGEGARELAVDADATYGELIREAGYHPQEASILVDGSPVPEDGVVDADRVKLLRLIKGGDGSAADGSVPEDSADENAPEGNTSDADELDLDFTLPNVGAGADPFILSDCDADLAVVLLHRHYLCGNCRKQVKAVTERYVEFVDRDAEVVSVVPTTAEKAAEWADSHDVPYPLLYDPEKAVGTQYGQPVKFGFLGRTFELLGRMPQATLIDLRREPELLWESAGNSPVDRPDVDDLLGEIDKFR